MTRESSNIIQLDSLGDHHHASLLIDPKQRKIAGGSVLNYSDHGLVGIKINSDGQAIGMFTHSGDTHFLRGELDSQGKFRGSYLDKQAGVKIAFSSSSSKLLKGALPAGSIRIGGDHHSTTLSLDEQGEVSGLFESQLTDASSFRIAMENGRISTGVFAHKGTHHTTSISLGSDRWKAEIGSDDEDISWSIGVENGLAGIRGDVKFKHEF